uniref:AlNc14C69G4789 protein n=1 Tax=Albugo laibachii Nc14 TaxID=890382 RepID=F0WDS0_9STRA|nr:AlNc14C69G4789 [Albugo laibachii Nc14]|eukprot:CCA19347.1 AlNc14C69G4789 [Albugo laibachii Nc14]
MVAFSIEHSIPLETQLCMKKRFQTASPEFPSLKNAGSNVMAAQSSPLQMTSWRQELHIKHQT